MIIHGYIVFWGPSAAGQQIQGEDGLDVVIEVLNTARAIGQEGAKIYLEVHHTHPAVFEDVTCWQRGRDHGGDDVRTSALRGKGQVSLICHKGGYRSRIHGY